MAAHDLFAHIEERLKIFQEHLSKIETSREEEMQKAFPKRNYHLLYMLKRDETLYEHCIAELMLIKQML